MMTPESALPAVSLSLPMLAITMSRGGVTGAALRVMAQNNFTLIADVEFGGNSNENYASGQISLEYLF